MTEHEWLTATDPQAMLQAHKVAFGERKLRLFSLACCERIRHLISDPRSVAALEFVRAHEAFVRVEPHKLAEVYRNASGVCNDTRAFMQRMPSDLTEVRDRWMTHLAATAVFNLMYEGELCGANLAARDVDDIASFEWVGIHCPEVIGHDFGQCFGRGVEHPTQVALLRDILGNPYRPVTRNSAWQTETALALATGIYADAAFDRLPILADALEEAGCDHPEILSHCRDPELVHVEGCWVVDLVLGKT